MIETFPRVLQTTRVLDCVEHCGVQDVQDHEDLTKSCRRRADKAERDADY